MAYRNRNTGKKEHVVFVSVLLAAFLTACGSSSSQKLTEGVYTESAAADMAPAAVAEDYAVDSIAAEAVETAEEYEYDGGAGMSYVMPEEGAIEEPAGSASEVPENAAERKLIKTVDISAETEQFDTLVPALQTQVEQLGGYIEEISIYDNDSYYDDSKWKTLRCVNMTARVPKEGLDRFLAQVGEQTNVVSRSERVEDVTLQYVDLDSHKRVLLSEQERLIELLREAETVEDIIAIEGRLSEVRYQIESMESQLRTYDNKIDYSTVYLYVNEVRKYTPPKDVTVWEKIGNGFVNSLEDIGNEICDFFIGFLINIPYIVLWGVIIAAAVLIIRVVIKRLKKSGKMKDGKWTGRLSGRKKGKTALEEAEPEQDAERGTGQETKRNTE